MENHLGTSDPKRKKFDQKLVQIENKTKIHFLNRLLTALLLENCFHPVRNYLLRFFSSDLSFLHKRMIQKKMGPELQL